MRNTSLTQENIENISSHEDMEINILLSKVETLREIKKLSRKIINLELNLKDQELKLKEGSYNV